MERGLTRVAHGIWRPADAVASLHGRLSALLRGCPQGTVVCGRTAAQLHSLWLPEQTTSCIEVVVHPDRPEPRSRAHGRRREVVTHRYRLAPEDVVLLDGLPVTSEARTWIDLARTLRMPDLVAAGDCVLRGTTSVADLDAAVAANRRRVGIVNARAALPLLDARSRSRPESHMRYAVVTSGLPRPEVNKPIHNRYGEWLAEPDLSYEDVRLAIEYNGADHATTERMRRDITREIDALTRGGWITVTFGPAEVFRHPDQVVITIAQLRRERARLLA